MDSIQPSTAFSMLMKQVRDKIGAYRNFITAAPETAAKIEDMFRTISYLVAGRIEGSVLISELIYSAANLLVYLHDLLLKGTELGRRTLAEKLQGKQANLLNWLYLLNVIEVVLEVGAERVFGVPGKWIMILAVQLIKACMRLCLLFRYESFLTTTAVLPRKSVSARLSEVPAHERNDPWHFAAQPVADEAQQYHSTLSSDTNERYEQTFELEHSGRKIRTLRAAPPLCMRNWELPLELPVADALSRVPTTEQTAAEVLYILRPIAHLIALLVSKDNSWRPWVLSASIELLSLRIHRMAAGAEYKNLHENQKAELKRRIIFLLYYFVRSPFFDKISKRRILGMLNWASNRLPLVHILADPLARYIPEWQKIYSYCWCQ